MIGHSPSPKRSHVRLPWPASRSSPAASARIAFSWPTPSAIGSLRNNFRALWNTNTVFIGSFRSQPGAGPSPYKCTSPGGALDA